MQINFIHFVLNRNHKLEGLVLGSTKNGSIYWYCYIEWNQLHDVQPMYSLKKRNYSTYCNNPGCRENKKRKKKILVCKHILGLIIERREKTRNIKDNLPSFMPESQEPYDHKINKILSIVKTKEGKTKYLCKWGKGIGENGKIQEYKFGQNLTWQDEVNDPELLKQYNGVLNHFQYKGLKAKYCYV